MTANASALKTLSIPRVIVPIWRHADVALLIAFPFLLMLITSAWTFYAPVGAVDTYVYTGFFLNLDKYLHVFPNTYYGSRFPWILLGNTAYTVLPNDIANLFLRFVLFYATTVSIYLAVRLVWKERTAAFLAALLVGTNVYFHSSIKWDYVDGPGLAGIALIFAGIAVGATTKWSGEGFFVTGLLITTTVSTQIALVIIVAPAAVWYVTLWYLNRRYSIFLGAAMIAMGMMFAYMFYAVIYHHITGNFNYLQPQIDFAQRKAENPYIAPLSSWIDTAGWLLFPAVSWFVSVAFALFGVFRVIKTRSLKAVDRGLLAMVALCVANLGFAASFAINQFQRDTALLQLPFYADYLIPLAFLTIGAALALVLREAPERWRLWIAAGASFAILLPFLIGLLGLFSQPVDGCATCKMGSSGTVLALSAALLLAAAFLHKKPAVVAVVLVALAFYNPGTASDFNANYFGPNSKEHQQFLLVYDANEAIEKWDQDGQLRIWFDMAEPLGSVYNGTGGLHLWGYRIMSAKFPAFDHIAAAPVMIPGRKIAILTDKPGAMQLAENELAEIAMKSEVLEERTIKRGTYSFKAYVINLVPGGIEYEQQLDLTATRAVEGAKLDVKGTGYNVTTQQPKWSYSALMKVPDDLKASYGDKRAFVRIEGIGLKGSTGVGILKSDRSGWVANAEVRSDKQQPYDIYIPVTRLADTSDIVVFNWDRDEVAQVRVTRVTIYIVAS